MPTAIRGLVVIVAMGAVFPNIVGAGLFRGPSDPCCGTCQRPQPQCDCVALKPIVETRYRQEPVVTYRDVPQTEYRLEAHTETIPVTTYENVTADEGGYQTVWVPKLVTKQVARTAYQQRQAYRSVPYQVNRRVPQYSSRTVPEQTVRYVPHRFQTAASPPVCNACGPAVPLATAPGLWAPLAAAPLHTAAIPVMPPLTVPPIARSAATSGYTPSPVPDPKFARTPSGGVYGQRTPVAVRSKNRAEGPHDRLAGYEVAPPRGSAVSARRAGKFQPAPSAATVWQSQRGTVRR